jgi:signal transduction histidine kinase
LNHSLLPRFEPQLEQEFQLRYFDRIRPTLRILTLLFAAMFLVYALRDYSDTQSLFLAATQDGAPAVFFLVLFALTYLPVLNGLWQWFIIVGGLFMAAISLGGQAYFLALTHPNEQAVAGLNSVFSSESLFFGQHMRLLMVCFSASRLQFRFALLMQTVLVIVGACTFFSHPVLGELTTTQITRFLQPTAAIFFVVLLAAFVEEQLARRAFFSAHQLEEERNDERRKRQQTEDKLHVLAQAIGGIVHDLGNPLTMVQMGASTLDQFIDQGLDKATLKEFTGAINSGAAMLNFLRLSLIEQTRVLEGKPTPVDLKPTLLCPIIESGVRFQKPHIAGNRPIRIDCQNVSIMADEMKMVTVFMNFIGNALKYSDGEIRVLSQEFRGTSDSAAMLLIAVLDTGKNGQGITQQQAASLFTAFGRLSTHSQIEGTGLGLLSVQKIAEAQGGEAFIEGFTEGTPSSPPFSTAHHAYPSLLTPEYRTAFVVTCPLAAASESTLAG